MKHIDLPSGQITLSWSAMVKAAHDSKINNLNILMDLLLEENTVEFRGVIFQKSFVLVWPTAERCKKIAKENRETIEIILVPLFRLFRRL